MKSPTVVDPPIIPPEAKEPAKEANKPVIVATIVAIAPILAGNGKPAAEAVQEAKASPCFAPIKEII